MISIEEAIKLVQIDKTHEIHNDDDNYPLLTRMLGYNPPDGGAASFYRVPGANVATIIRLSEIIPEGYEKKQKNMRSKTIKIPIYGCELTIIFDDNLSYIEKEYGTTSLEDFGAVTLRDKKKYRHYVAAFTDIEHLSNIAHEIVHIKNLIYVDCAMELDRFNDEPEAYLTGWLFDEIYNFLLSNSSIAKMAGHGTCGTTPYNTDMK